MPMSLIFSNTPAIFLGKETKNIHIVCLCVRVFIHVSFMSFENVHFLYLHKNVYINT